MGVPMWCDGPVRLSMVGFLGTGLMTADFRRDGMVACAKDVLEMQVKMADS